MRVRRDVVEEISEDDADDARRRRGRSRMRMLTPGEREHRHPHRAEDDRAAEIGLLHQQEGDARRSAPPRSDRPAATCRCPCRLSSQAIATTKKGFRNSDGWTWPTPKSIQRRAPFSSGPMIGTKISSTKKKAAPNSDRRRARSLRHHRNADHHRHAERDPGQLAPEIIELGEADVAARIALRRRRATRRRPRSGRSRSARVTSSSRTLSISQNQRPSALTVGAAVAARIDQRRLGLDLAGDALDHKAPTSSRNWSPALLEIAELVERRAGRRQQHRIARLAASAAASRTAASSVSHICHRHVRRLSSRANNSPASPIV